MADVPERLFRDETGAALERVARLEQENQQLRAELRRFERPGDVPTLRTRGDVVPRTGAVLAGLGAALFMTMAAVGFVHRASAPPARFHSQPAFTDPTLLGATPIAPVTYPAMAVDDPNDCETPYSYDDQGVKHYKMQCIHPERTKR